MSVFRSIQVISLFVFAIGFAPNAKGQDAAYPLIETATSFIHGDHVDQSITFQGSLDVLETKHVGAFTYVLAGVSPNANSCYSSACDNYVLKLDRSGALISSAQLSHSLAPGSYGYYNHMSLGENGDFLYLAGVRNTSGIHLGYPYVRIAKYSLVTDQVIWERAHEASSDMVPLPVTFIEEVAYSEATQRLTVVSRNDVISPCTGTVSTTWHSVVHQFDVDGNATNSLVMEPCSIGAPQVYGYHMQVRPNGNLVFTGTTNYAGAGSTVLPVWELDTNLNLLWRRDYDDNGLVVVADPNGIELAENGDVLVYGSVQYNPTATFDRHATIVRYRYNSGSASAGTDDVSLVWDETFQINGENLQVGFLRPVGDEVVAQIFPTFTHGSWVIRRYDASGNEVWTTSAGKPSLFELDRVGNVLSINEVYVGQSFFLELSKYSAVDGSLLTQELLSFENPDPFFSDGRVVRLSHAFIREDSSELQIVIGGKETSSLIGYRYLAFMRLEQSFERGDVNFDGSVNVSDAISLLNRLFLGIDVTVVLDAADVNDDGSVNVGDAIGLLGFLFQGQSEPAQPFGSPGLDPTPDPIAEP